MSPRLCCSIVWTPILYLNYDHRDLHRCIRESVSWSMTSRAIYKGLCMFPAHPDPAEIMNTLDHQYEKREANRMRELREKCAAKGKKEITSSASCSASSSRSPSPPKRRGEKEKASTSVKKAPPSGGLTASPPAAAAAAATKKAPIFSHDDELVNSIADDGGNESPMVGRPPALVSQKAVPPTPPPVVYLNEMENHIASSAVPPRVVVRASTGECGAEMSRTQSTRPSTFFQVCER